MARLATFVNLPSADKVPPRVRFSASSVVHPGRHYNKAVDGTTVTTQKNYAFGAQTVAARVNGTLHWLVSDHLGSTSVTANADGSFKSQIQYTAFGEIRASAGITETEYRYTGQLRQAEVGLYYYVARFYDPYLNRFAQADTIIPLESQGTQAWDRYAGMNNNPVRYNDPSGHCIGPWILLCFAVGVVGISASVDLVEQGAVKMTAASSDPRFSGEQVAIQQWQDNCMGQCHYAHVANPSGTTGPRPETPMTDEYSSGMVDAINGTIGFVGGTTFLAAIPKPPMPGTLSNYEARKWYLQQETKISGLIDDPALTLEQRARLAFDLRNYYRTQARNLMADRKLAERLMLEEPNLTWEQIIQKGMNKGLTGDDIYFHIIRSSQKSRPGVNQQFNLHTPQ